MGCFKRGDSVEVCSKQEGLLGSYFEAKVLLMLDDVHCVVKYKNLLRDDESGRLIERVHKDEIRPLPPKPKKQRGEGFDMYDVVDAFDNDGWWVGMATGVKLVGDEIHHYVYFHGYGVELTYPLSRLRAHQEWVSGNWVSSRKARFLR